MRFVVVGGVLLGLTIAGRGEIAAAGRESAADVRRHVRAAGPLHVLALLAIIGIGIALRLAFYDAAMRWDESYTFLAYVSKPVGDALAVYDYPNNHVLHTALAHVSCSVLSDLQTCGPSAIRAPVFAAGVVVPLAAYAAAAQIYGRHAALFAAALAASSAQLVEYATNARGYEIVTLAGLVLLALAPRLLRSANPTYWVLFVVVGALGFYTVPVFGYAFAVIVAALALAVALERDGSRTRRLLAVGAAGTATVALAALLYGPILDDVIRGGSSGQENRYATDAQYVAEQVWKVWTLGLPGAAKLVLLAGFAASILIVDRRSHQLPVAAAFAAVVLAAAGAGRVVEFTRVWVPQLALFLVAAVGGLLGWRRVRDALDGRTAGIAVALAAVAVAGGLAYRVSSEELANHERSYLPASGSIATLLAQRLTGNDRVLVTIPGWAMAAYAFKRTGLTPDLLALRIAPPLPPGRTYLVVNEMAGETPTSALAATAKGTGLKLGRRIAKFEGALLYELAPPA